MKTAVRETLKNIPPNIDSNATLQLVKSNKHQEDYFNLIKTVTQESDEEISHWLSIDVKSFKSYQKSRQKTRKPVLVEQIIMLISLYKHGFEIFGTSGKFKEWLEKSNFYFDKKAPVDFMDTISGIKFIDDRLTALEYGDNA